MEGIEKERKEDRRRKEGRKDERMQRRKLVKRQNLGITQGPETRPLSQSCGSEQVGDALRANLTRLCLSSGAAAADVAGIAFYAKYKACVQGTRQGTAGLQRPVLATGSPASPGLSRLAKAEPSVQG